MKKQSALSVSLDITHWQPDVGKSSGTEGALLAAVSESLEKTAEWTWVVAHALAHPGSN